ncbi:hypothetical protein Acr_26g0005280 [Actinidia rufa]|uniref:Protein kinase domain-containing protein n=1 Tax=Actinidia rufa TaxID=165716 RepID=A0A7J0H2L0_9ERIC|nr:hypothetical protein Acr_26g0005280 [Actinidia rufa]
MKRKREVEFQCEKVEEVKQRSTDKCGGDGVAWFRGSMIGKGSFGSVYLANLKKPRSRFGCFPEVMAVKSAEMSVSGSIQKEREALSNIGRCPNIIQCFGDETTTGENGEMVYNLLLEFGSGGTLADLIKKSGGSGLSESEEVSLKNILLVPNKNGVGAKFKSLPQIFGLSGCIVLEMVTGKPPWFGKEDMDAEALLHMIGEGYESPKIPDKISREGREFLKGCFSRKSMFRFTAEMLLNHSFLEELVDDGVDDDEDNNDEVEEGEEILVSDEVDSPLMLFKSDDEECSCSFYSDDYSYESDEEFLFSSRSEEREEIDSRGFSGFSEEGKLGGQERTDTTGSITASSLDDVISTQANSVQQCPITFPIPSGV